MCLPVVRQRAGCSIVWLVLEVRELLEEQAGSEHSARGSQEAQVRQREAGSYRREKSSRITYIPRPGVDTTDLMQDIFMNSNHLWLLKIVAYCYQRVTNDHHKLISKEMTQGNVCICLNIQTWLSPPSAGFSALLTFSLTMRLLWVTVTWRSSQSLG